MRRGIQLVLAACAALAAGCHSKPAADTHRPWVIKPGLWRTEYLDGGAADVSCVDPQVFSTAPRAGLHGCDVLRFQSRSDGFILEGRCRTDWRPDLVWNEVHATNDGLVQITFSDKTEGVPGPLITSHQRMTFIGACPTGWRKGDWLDLKPSDGRWRVLRTPPGEGPVPPVPITVMEYPQLPPMLRRLTAH